MMYTTYQSLNDRGVIVSGGASGIGEELVRAFAVNGARVAFLDIQEASGKALVQSIGQQVKHEPLFVHCDLTDIKWLQAALARVRQELGPATVLVNNAADDQRQSFQEVGADQFDWMMAVNLRHVFFMSQAVVPQMIDVGGGSIINMSSITWMVGERELQAYAAAKAAIVGFTNSLAREVGRHRIRVNTIAPGLVLTEKQRRLWFRDESKMAEYVGNQLLPDIIEPRDIAKLALFLASEESRMVTKQTWSVNGGWL
jgi:NAD(P)-dependent dehydrogenase (short-subunit alcohol dehydrogenase family)